MKKHFIIIFFLTAIYISCSEDQVEPSNLTLLTNNEVKSWRVVEIEENGLIDELNCQRDNIFTFELFNEETETSQFEIEDNLVSCDGESNYIVANGTWRLNNKGNRITLIVRDEYSFTNDNDQEQEATDFLNLVYDIVKISKSELILRSYEEWNEFDPKVYTYTLTEI